MAANSIYYLFLAQGVTGGYAVALEHIAALNAFGFDAKAFFLHKGEPAGKIDVPVAGSGIRLQPDDIVVVGESDAPVLDSIAGAPCIKILHNQNPYYTILGFGSVARLNDFGFRRVMVPSDFCAARLTNLGVRAPISRVRPALPDYFQPGAKRPQIAYSPRKRPHEASYLMEYFRSQMPEYAEIPWLAITHMSRAEGAAIMAQSAVYAAFPALESLGLMNLEAMASGCRVVGYTGLGGAEYASPENGDWVDDGDHPAFAAGLRTALQAHASGVDDARTKAGRRTAALFTRENFEQELKAAWLSILSESAHRYRKA